MILALAPSGSPAQRFAGTLGLPRAGVAAMWAEGQLPKPSLRRTEPSEDPADRGLRAA